MSAGYRPMGLKLLRSGNGPSDPNAYWKRKPREKCKRCSRRVRGPNHTKIGAVDGGECR